MAVRNHPGKTHRRRPAFVVRYPLNSQQLIPARAVRQGVLYIDPSVEGDSRVIEYVGSNDPFELLVCKLIRESLVETVSNVIRIFFGRGCWTEFSVAPPHVSAVPYRRAAIQEKTMAHFKRGPKLMVNSQKPGDRIYLLRRIA